MKQETDPRKTTRAYAFDCWMKAPMPMVTFFTTLNVSRLIRYSRRHGMKFNMLMCWCSGMAASGIKEFYMLPEGDKLMQFDSIAVNTIVMNRNGLPASHIPICLHIRHNVSFILSQRAIPHYLCDKK